MEMRFLHLILVTLLSTRPSSVIGQFDKGRDFYAILGVPKTATEAQVKKQYRQLAKKYHPDNNRDNADEARKKFVDIADAHDVLTDPEKRAKFDQFGEKGLDPNFNPHSPFRAGGSTFVFHSRNFGFDGHGEGGFMFFDPFGGGHPFAGGGRGPVENSYEETAVVDINSPTKWKDVVHGDDARNWVTLVKFYSPRCEPCRAMKKDYIEVAIKYKNIVTVAAVNCLDQQGGLPICQANQAQRYPTIRMYFGDESTLPVSYSGERKAKELSMWLSDRLPSSAVELSRSNLEMWLSAERDLPKVIFFTKQPVTPPLVKAISSQYKGKVWMAVVNKFSDLVPTFEPKTWPSLLHLTDIESLKGEWVEVTNSLESLSLKMSRFISQKRQNSGDYVRLRYSQLGHRSYSNGVCGPNESNTCIILVKFQDRRAEKDVDSALLAAAAAYEKDPIRFVWMDGSVQEQFVKAFGIKCNDRKNMCPFHIIAYRPKRGKYEVVVFEENQKLTEEKIRQVVDRILESGGATLSQKIIKSNIPSKLVPISTRQKVADEL